MRTMNERASALLLLLLASCVAVADSDDGGTQRWWSWSAMSQDVAAVNNTLYAKECGSCHMAYQPGLLPQRSWQRVMASLEDHFGDDASLDPEQSRAIADYLSSNAADRSNYKRSTQFAATSGAPLRISETSYFQRKHHEVSDRMVSGNPDVGSWSNCNACHSGAAEGDYAEDRIKIPGYGRWED